MRVAYKWAITSTKVAYITGGGEQFNEPYICDIASCADNDESVANLASLMTEVEYKANFEKMVILLKNDEDGKYYSLYPYDYYFNAEDNECLSTIDTGITINTQVSVKTLECDQEAAVNIITAGTKDSQTVSFEFSIPKGCQGPQGPRGTSGSGTTAGDSYRTFFIYKSSDTKPDTPTGGSFTVNPDIDGGGIFNAPEGWSTDSDLTGIIWMSNATYNISNGDRMGNWSTPIRLTGESGNAGEDVDSTEFIYKRTATYPIDGIIALPTLNDKNQDDFVPTDEGWTDNPQGISPDFKCEWACYRDIAKDDPDNKWGDWQGPALWARWGENGADGDGVQYIYCNLSATLAEIPSPNQIGTDSDQFQEIGEYEGVEYIPTGWTDNPSGVNDANPVEWVSQRKRKDGKWGEFSEPAVWSKQGEKGDTGEIGVSYRVKYQAFPTTGITDGETGEVQMAPSVNKTNANPGSAWSDSIPSYNSDENLWAIAAYLDYKNELSTLVSEYGWTDPWVMTGIEGKSGVAPNYTTMVFALNVYQPESPATGVTADNPGSSNANDPTDPAKTVDWLDYPSGESGIWWMCVGSVRGIDNVVTEWATPIKVTGVDGDAKDGKWTEFRFAYGTAETYPTFDNTKRNPGDDWVTDLSQVVKPTNPTVYMIHATITPDNLLEGIWLGPTQISGEQGPQGSTGPAGPQGPTGANGVSGIPGVSFKVLYAKGTEDEVTGSWSENVPSNTELTGSSIYVWCKQGTETYSYNDNGELISLIEYGEPFRLSGLRGLAGASGGKGQLIYPAGIYDPNKTYTTDEYSAPYVLDTSDGNFYVLNAQMTWLGSEQGGKTPKQSYEENGGEYWLKFDAFEAIYTKVGVIANGLIGSAVFNGDYMFSQQGVNYDSESNIYITYNYKDFDPTDPFNEYNSFIPQICINFKTGEAWLAHGLIHFSSNGMEITTSGGTKTSLDGMYDSIQGVQGDVSGLTETVSNYSTKIEQNAEAIKLKADFTTVESLQTDVEGLYTNVGTLNNKITSNTTAIEANAQQIALKASKEEVINIGNRLGDAESTIQENTAAIQVNANEISSVVSKQEKVGVEFETSRWVGNDGFSYFVFKNGGGYYVVYSKNPQAHYNSCTLLTIDNVSAGDKIHIEGNNMFIHIIGCDENSRDAEQGFFNEYPSNYEYYSTLGFGGDHYSDDGVNIIDWVATSNWAKVYIMLTDDNASAYQTAKTTLIRSAYTSESRIKQTAEEIELKVKDCGINIDEKKITLTANNTIVDGTLSVQQVNCYYPNGSVKSSFNGQGNGTIAYYYPITPDSAVTETNIYGQIMKCEIFTYDSDTDDVTGLITRYYKKDGSLAWEQLEDGSISTEITSWWDSKKIVAITGTTIQSFDLTGLVSDDGTIISGMSTYILSIFRTTDTGYTAYDGNYYIGKRSVPKNTMPLKGNGAVLNYPYNFFYLLNSGPLYDIDLQTVPDSKQDTSGFRPGIAFYPLFEVKKGVMSKAFKFYVDNVTDYDPKWEIISVDDSTTTV